MVVKLILLFVYLPFGLTYDHAAPVPVKLWQQRCDKRSRVLNDCNWCTCNVRSSYNCEARVCSEIDQFGHFNDAIQELHVGMEGHGSWRSTATPCEPNVSYQKKDLLCICNEDGNWPNPICRDTFKTLHPVEVMKDKKKAVGKKCSPSKLYLVDCNVCLCPSSGQIDLKYCTKRICTKDDPVFKKPSAKYEAEEVYAECKPNQKYKLGCKNCLCIKNNRLLCDNCTNDSYCSDKEVGVPFNIDCNICHCDDKGLLYCTVKICIKKLNRAQIVGGVYKLTTEPDDDLECKPGTKYHKDCNTCYCFLKNNEKNFACTMEKCPKSQKVKDCVEGTSYRVDCLICQCGRLNGVKMQICSADPKCFAHNARTFNNLRSLNGYCEPLHIYKNGCNICECLQDGKTVKCTSESCKELEQKPIDVELIPVVQELTGCPKGQSYKIDCNYCFCLANGNALCTTLKC